MHTQQRSGLPSRPKNHDHTVWEAEGSDWSHRLLVPMIVLALIAVGYAVTGGAPV